MSAYRLQLAASGAVLVASIAFATSAALANAKVCRSQEQRYEQIERDPTSIEINAALFSAADKGCTRPRSQAARVGRLARCARPHGRKTACTSCRGRRGRDRHALSRSGRCDRRRRISTARRRCIKAAENGRLPVVQLLVERGANVSLPGRSGITPLSAAAYMGSVPIVELLMEKGADPKPLDNTGKTAIIYAAGRGFSPVVRLLARPRRRRQCALRQRSHRADVGGRLFGRGRRARRGRGHDAAARSRRAYRRRRTIAGAPR